VVIAMSAEEVDIELLEPELEPEGDPVEIDLETGEPPKAEPEPVEKETDEGLESLKRQLAEVERRRAETEIARQAEVERRFHAERELTEAQRSTINATYQAVSSRLEALDRDAEMAENALSNAMANNDAAQVAKVTRILARIEGERRDVERDQSVIAQRQQRPVVTEGPVERQPSDPVEAFASTLTPASAAWIRAHPEVVTNQALSNKARAAHFSALSEGVAAETPEYFAAINRHMGFTKEEAPVDRPAEVRKAVPAAPPNRSSGGPAPRSVTLSPAEQETATMMGMTLKEYALSKLEIERDRAAGRIK